jgi:anti-sigma regulatory factor (Ser/Thr protein kinase)
VSTASFEPVPESAKQARCFVRDCLAGRAVSNPDVAVLLVSEMATNAIVHSRLTFTVSVEVSADCVQVAVSDLRAVLPAPHQLDDDDTGGLGLAMVAAAADRWGIAPTDGGTRAWFELCCGSA